jgi:hypothetical protein
MPTLIVSSQSIWLYISVLFGKELYLDPGTGSFLIQVVLAGLMGALLFTKLYWKKIKKLFTHKSEEPSPLEDDDREP